MPHTPKFARPSSRFPRDGPAPPGTRSSNRGRYGVGRPLQRRPLDQDIPGIGVTGPERGTFGIFPRRFTIGWGKASAETAAPLDRGPPRHTDRDRDMIPRCAFGAHSLDFHILGLGP